MNRLKDVFLKLRNGYNVKKVRDMLKMIYPPKKLTFDVLLNDRTQLLERVGEYLSKVYAGEEYFNDYDCFVGRICEPKFELKCGNILVEFNLNVYHVQSRKSSNLTIVIRLK
uniref:Uncharacterized protein n=1 Tax=Panagrolaimus sp. JU765 TaxID=591449 RepID=A0AC34PXI5_9BILA